MSGLLLTLLGLRPLVVYRAWSNAVELPSGWRYLYGLRVVSNVERIKTPPPYEVNKLLSVQGRGKILFEVWIKDEDPETGYYLHDLYYFSFSRELLETLAGVLGRNNVQLLSGLDLANTLYRCLFARLNARIEERIPVFGANFFSSSEDVVLRGRALSRELEEDDYRVFVGVAYNGQASRIEGILETRWRGALWIVFDFENVDLVLRRKKAKAAEERDVYDQALEDLRKGKVSLAGISCILISPREHASQEAATSLMNALGFSWIEKKYLKGAYVKATPLMFRDYDFTYVLDARNVKDYLVASYEKTSLPSRVEVFGRNRFGSYVGYNVFEENPAPHVGFFAPTGTGKSFGLQKLFSQILGVSARQLITGEETPRLREDVRVRWLDKGFSAELFMRLMKERGLNVGIFSSSLDEISYNPCDLDDLSEDDLEFSAGVLNVCLEAVGLRPMGGYEEAWWVKALKHLYSLPPESLSFPSQYLYNLASYPPMREIYGELLRLGYSDRQKLSDLSPEHKKRYSFLFKPTLADVVRYLTAKAGDVSLTEEERKSAESLKTKLSVLLEHPAVSLPTQIDLSSSRVVYVDYEFLSKSKFFNALLLAILWRLVKTDKFRKKGERVYYVVDEAHNLFSLSSFSKALEVLVREARKWGISLWFATQSPDDLPPQALSNIYTRVFLSPPDVSQRHEFFQKIKTVFSLPEDSDVEAVFSSAPERSYVFWYSRGVFSLVLPVDRYDRMLFDSRRTVLETEDGLVIRKGFLEVKGGG